MMLIRPMKQSDLSACADILCSVYNNDLWQCNWDKSTAEAYLSDFFHMAKFVGFVIEEEGEIFGGIFAREAYLLFVRCHIEVYQRAGGGKVSAQLQSLSWNVFRFKVQ